MSEQDETIEASVPAGTAAALDAVAKATGRDRTWVIREALQGYLAGDGADAIAMAEAFAAIDAVDFDTPAEETEPATVQQDTDPANRLACLCLAPCIRCGRPLEDESAANNQPVFGLAFQSWGHWPSAVFDCGPGWLEINVCEPCLHETTEKGRILHGDRAARGSPTEYGFWTWPERAPEPKVRNPTSQLPYGSGISTSEPMTAGRLADLLAGQPPERRVVLKGYEAGYADVAGLRERRLKLNWHKWWFYGPHEAIDEQSPPTEADETAIEIVRIDREPD